LTIFLGKLASVRKGLSSLKEELVKQKELAEEWERKYKALTASREGLQLMNLVINFLLYFLIKSRKKRYQALKRG